MEALVRKARVHIDLVGLRSPNSPYIDPEVVHPVASNHPEADRPVVQPLEAVDSRMDSLLAA